MISGLTILGIMKYQKADIGFHVEFRILFPFAEMSFSMVYISLFGDFYKMQFTKKQS